MFRRHGMVPIAALLVVLSVVLIGARSDVLATTCWPPPVAAPVADPFRTPTCPWCPGNRGLEYDTLPGAIVRAVAAGIVTFSGVVARVRYVVIETATGWRITYGRLDATGLRRGDRVAAGSVVGRASDRFHFGLRDGDRYLDPAPFLGRWRYRPRLVPVDGSPGAGPVVPHLRCGPTGRSVSAERGGIGGPAR